MRIAQTIALALILSACTSRAATVRLSWRANPESDLTGYEILIATDAGDQVRTIRTGPETTLDIPDLIPGQTCRVVIYARIRDFKSPPSAEIHIPIPASVHAPKPPPATIVREFMFSTDLKKWKSVGYFEVPDDSTTFFLRASPPITVPSP